MLTNQIGSVLKQALITFSGRSEVFYQNLEILKAMLEKTTAEDVNLHPQFMTETLWKRQNKAPVTYVDIFEDCNITIGIFILKPGMKLPLHNHPQMHGLIKVLAGTVKVTSYSLNTDKTKEIDKDLTAATSNLRFTHQSIIVERCGESRVDATCSVCELEPEKRNLHEIESVDGPAAFLDILAPPYETKMSNNGVRKCSFYRILKEMGPSIYRLQEIDTPHWYWTDSYPYDGPDLE